MEVIARRFPVQHEVTLDGVPIAKVFAEAYRVLGTTGDFVFQRSSRSDSTDSFDVALMQGVGFSPVMVFPMAVIGQKS